VKRLTKVNNIKELLESYANIRYGIKITSYNFIDEINRNCYKISVNESDKDEDNFWVSLYEVYMTDSEFRILEED